MAKLDEYKFPDEIEDSAENEVAAEADEGSLDVDIEVVDDTPPADRNRDPVPDNIKEELETADTSKHYSKNVKDKLHNTKKLGTTSVGQKRQLCVSNKRLQQRHKASLMRINA